MSVQKPRPRFGYRPEPSVECTGHVPSTLVEQLQLAWHWYEPERLVSSFRMCCIGGPCERHRDERKALRQREIYEEHVKRIEETFGKGRHRDHGCPPNCRAMCSYVPGGPNNPDHPLHLPTTRPSSGPHT